MGGNHIMAEYIYVLVLDGRFMMFWSVDGWLHGSHPGTMSILNPDA